MIWMMIPKNIDVQPIMMMMKWINKQPCNDFNEDASCYCSESTHTLPNIFQNVLYLTNREDDNIAFLEDYNYSYLFHSNVSHVYQSNNQHVFASPTTFAFVVFDQLLQIC